VTVHLCSLILKEPQTIQPGTYTAVRFPFGEAESYDEHRMHQVAQPDGHRVGDWRKDTRAALIWPDMDGLGILTAMVQWEPGTYGELGARFVRDPLKLTTGWDATGTDERPPTRSRQRSALTHQMIVHPGTPIALEVCHDASTTKKLLLAEFKLSIHPLAKGD
jgi:hypothetical protein